MGLANPTLKKTVIRKKKKCLKKVKPPIIKIEALTFQPAYFME
jgi:hypothetical protein